MGQTLLSASFDLKLSYTVCLIVDANDLQPSLNATEIAETRVRICAHPVFIVGSPRSGTTILAWSLAKHSQLWTSDESQILWDLFEGGRLGKNYRRRDHYDGSWLCKQRVRREEFLGYVGVGLNGLFTSRSNGKRWIDQTPLYVMLAHNLVDMFPGSFFIHILRDGRNVVHSMINVLTARFVGHELPDVVKNSPKPAWMTDFRDACRTWRRFVTVAMELQAAFPRRCLTVRNEQLLADPVQGFREILRGPSERAPTQRDRPTVDLHVETIHLERESVVESLCENSFVDRGWTPAPIYEVELELKPYRGLTLPEARSS